MTQNHKTNHTPSETFIRGGLFHPDPDRLVAYKQGIHEYGTIGEAKRAYVNGDLSVLELEAVLESVIPHQEQSSRRPQPKTTNPSSQTTQR